MSAAPDPWVVQVQDLAKRYGASPVFESVNLQVGAGQFVAVVGDSGVGKSTLLNCCLLYTSPSPRD